MSSFVDNTHMHLHDRFSHFPRSFSSRKNTLILSHIPFNKICIFLYCWKDIGTKNHYHKFPFVQNNVTNFDKKQHPVARHDPLSWINFCYAVTSQQGKAKTSISNTFTYVSLKLDFCGCMFILNWTTILLKAYHIVRYQKRNFHGCDIS